LRPRPGSKKPKIVRSWTEIDTEKTKKPISRPSPRAIDLGPSIWSWDGKINRFYVSDPILGSRSTDRIFFGFIGLGLGLEIDFFRNLGPYFVQDLTVLGPGLGLSPAISVPVSVRAKVNLVRFRKNMSMSI